MPDASKKIVINTTPLIALTAALGKLDVLNTLYSRVLKASSIGYPLLIPEALDRMRARGIWLSQGVIPLGSIFSWISNMLSLRFEIRRSAFCCRNDSVLHMICADQFSIDRRE